MVVEQLAAELEVELAAEALATLVDVLCLKGEILLAVEPGSARAVHGRPA